MFGNVNILTFESILPGNVRHLKKKKIEQDSKAACIGLWVIWEREEREGYTYASFPVYGIFFERRTQSLFEIPRILDIGTVLRRMSMT